MKSSSLLVLFLLSGSFFVSAQSPDTIPSASKAWYFNSLRGGGLFAKKGNGYGESFTMIHGIRLNRFAFGMGVGYDSYNEWRAIPVFGSVHYEIAQVRDYPLFIELNAGYARARYIPDDEADFISGWKRGPFFHPLLGYRIRRNKLSIYLTAGYKFQLIGYERTVVSWGFPGSLRRIYIDRYIERISIQLGFGFR